MGNFAGSVWMTVYRENNSTQCAVIYLINLNNSDVRKDMQFSIFVPTFYVENIFSNYQIVRTTFETFNFILLAVLKVIKC